MRIVIELDIDEMEKAADLVSKIQDQQLNKQGVFMDPEAVTRAICDNRPEDPDEF